jgi:hypothetical protein
MVVSERLWLVSFPVKVFAFQLILAGSLVAWFVLTDFASQTLLKLLVGIALCSLVLGTALPPEIYARLRKGIE